MQLLKCTHLSSFRDFGAPFRRGRPSTGSESDTFGDLLSSFQWVCDPYRIEELRKNKKDCIVYSIGSNNEFS